jgi:2-oxoglutarate-Fe(II)-dependent oxygenase superfamily protein
VKVHHRERREICPDYAAAVLRIRGSVVPSEQVALPSPEQVALLRDEFRRRHCLLLPGLLEPDLADRIARAVDGSAFVEREHVGIGTEACMEVNSALAWLLLLVNDERIFDLVRSVTGCRPIGHFDGRVYRLKPSSGHHDSWHGDLGDGRLIAMSINLSRAPYEGGALQIRDRRTGETAEARSERLGDALMFELGEHLEHRVMELAGTAPRTVFAGWFKEGANLLSVLAAPSRA